MHGKINVTINETIFVVCVGRFRPGHGERTSAGRRESAEGVQRVHNVTNVSDNNIIKLHIFVSALPRASLNILS